MFLYGDGMKCVKYIQKNLEPSSQRLYVNCLWVGPEHEWLLSKFLGSEFSNLLHIRIVWGVLKSPDAQAMAQMN